MSLSLPTIIPDNMVVAANNDYSEQNGIDSLKAASSIIKGHPMAMGGATSKAAPAKKAPSPRKRWKKPADKPKRPLSAYNLFFQSERRRIITQMEENGEVEKGTASALAEGQRRPHRKSSGVGFKQLAQTISQRWKGLDSATRAPFEAEAAKEKEKYNTVLAAWKEERIKKEREEKGKLEEAAEENPDQDQQQPQQRNKPKKKRPVKGASNANQNRISADGSQQTLPQFLPFVNTAGIGGLTPQQQQQYLASLANIGLPTGAPISKAAYDMQNTSLLEHLKMANAMINQGNAGSTPNAQHPGASMNVLLNQPQQHANPSSAQNATIVTGPSASLPGQQGPQNQQQQQPPMDFGAVVRRLSNFQQFQQAGASSTNPNPPNGSDPQAPSGGGAAPPIDWDSLRMIANQSDASGMAAAAVSAATGANAGEEENPIEAISRAQAFLSNLKASLESGQT